MDGWNTILSYWEFAYFQGQIVSFREGACLCLVCWDSQLRISVPTFMAVAAGTIALTRHAFKWDGRGSLDDGKNILDGVMIHQGS